MVARGQFTLDSLGELGATLGVVAGLPEFGERLARWYNRSSARRARW